MTKVSAYLQSHLVGEVSTRQDVRQNHGRDNGILLSKPEMVAYPRSTNDIRKAMRFAWQLAEKGHVMQITTQGSQQDVTGAGVGKGMSLDVSRHMNRIFEYDGKQKLIRLQPGVSVATVKEALGLHGTTIPALPQIGTVGGAVANNADGRLSGKYGTIDQWVDKLEIVLASGEVMQTERISKRELAKRKGIQGREGDIYRGIDAVLEDHAEYIDGMQNDGSDKSGFAGIADVRGKGGSFDLTPLIIGSQGTLAVISEMILKTEYVPSDLATGVAFFSSREAAHDALDGLQKFDFAYLEYIDGSYLQAAKEQGNDYEWLEVDVDNVAVMVLFGFDTYNERAQKKQLKKVQKTLEKLGALNVHTSLQADGDKLTALGDVMTYTQQPTNHADRVAPALIPGCFVPAERFDEFVSNLALLESQLHVALPLYGSVLRGIYTITPTISLQKVSDRQKALKIIDQVGALVAKHGGSLVARDGEGRLLSRFARAQWDDEYAEIVKEIRTVFDPHAMLNTSVKADVELRELVTSLRSDNNL